MKAAASISCPFRASSSSMREFQSNKHMGTASTNWWSYTFILNAIAGDQIISNPSSKHETNESLWIIYPKVIVKSQRTEFWIILTLQMPVAFRIWVPAVSSDTIILRTTLLSCKQSHGWNQHRLKVLPLGTPFCGAAQPNLLQLWGLQWVVIVTLRYPVTTRKISHGAWKDPILHKTVLYS